MNGAELKIEPKALLEVMCYINLKYHLYIVYNGLLSLHVTVYIEKLSYILTYEIFQMVLKCNTREFGN